MSRLPSRASVSKTSTLAKIPEGSISGLPVRLQLVKGAKPGASGKDTPGSLSIMVHQRVEIPYAFVAPKAPQGQIPKNTIAKPLTGDIVKPRVLEPGQTYLISMFKPPTTLTCGNLYRLDGVYLDAYMGPRIRKNENGVSYEEQMTAPELSLKCARISVNVDEITDDEFDQSIEFQRHSIIRARDIPDDNRVDTYTIDADKGPYYTFTTLIGTKEDKPGTLEGFFQAPFDDYTPTMEYEPFNKAKGAREPAMLALTGGCIKQDPPIEAQLHIQQNNLDGSVEVYKVFTIVKENQGLSKFQLDWKLMGHILGPKMIGKATCTINRTKTKELEEDPAFNGTLYCNTTIRPDMGAMVKAIGYKMPFNLCVQFDPRLKELEVLLSNIPQIRYQDATALNLLRYTGNASLLPLAEERGWVEFYVTTNMPIDDDERRQEIDAMTPEQKAAEFRNKKFYAGIQQCVGVFAVATKDSPLKLHEMVSAKDTPSGALLFENAKKIKTED